jgi:hypothetical protein
MNPISKGPNGGVSEAAHPGQAGSPPAAKSELTEALPASPTLSGYFLERKVSAPEFLRTLKAKRITRFEQDDYATAERLIEKEDPDGERLWRLISQASLPEATRSWVWNVTRGRLAALIGPGSDLDNIRPVELLDQVRKVLRRVPTPWVRIIVSYLIQRRGIDAGQVLNCLGTVAHKADSSANPLLAKALRSGSQAEFNLAVAVGFMSNKTLQDVERERARLADDVSSLRRQIQTGEAMNAALNENISRANEKGVKLSARIESLQEQLEMERRHWRFDNAQLEKKNKSVLSDRIKPLVSDAIDALEIVPPVPAIALNRMQKIASIVDETSQ